MFNSVVSNCFCLLFSVWCSENTKIIAKESEKKMRRERKQFSRRKALSHRKTSDSIESSKRTSRQRTLTQSFRFTRWNWIVKPSYRLRRNIYFIRVLWNFTWFSFFLSRCVHFGRSLNVSWKKDDWKRSCENIENKERKVINSWL